MSLNFPEFDRSRLIVDTLDHRDHLLDLSCIKALNDVKEIDSKLLNVASRIKKAKLNDSSIVLMMGAHVLRSGMQHYIIDLMKKGLISCIALNGAGVIHDFEFALVGATTESVADYIRKGQFGLWKETGLINEIVSSAANENLGLGEAVGRYIEKEKLPNREVSLLGSAYRYGCPVTVHVGIGNDILHEHPNCNGAAYGQTSYTDFLRFTHVLESLEGGVIMNFGSSVMAPEVYLKALAMVRNVAHQEDRKITDFTTLVCDLIDLPENYRQEASKNSAGYYFRPWKTMLIRTVADGGESFYVKGRHEETIPQLWTAINAVI
jgi:hypothetical protein